MAEPEKQGQLAVLKDAFKLVRREKPLAYVWCGLIFVVVLVGGYFIGIGLHHPVYFGILSVPLALLGDYSLAAPDSDGNDGNSRAHRHSNSTRLEVFDFKTSRDCSFRENSDDFTFA